MDFPAVSANLVRRPRGLTTLNGPAEVVNQLVHLLDDGRAKITGSRNHTQEKQVPVVAGTRPAGLRLLTPTVLGQSIPANGIWIATLAFQPDLPLLSDDAHFAGCRG